MFASLDSISTDSGFSRCGPERREGMVLSFLVCTFVTRTQLGHHPGLRGLGVRYYKVSTAFEKISGKDTCLFTGLF